MDKKQGHIDQDFLDESWANMSELLDKEMPVKKRKRRFVWLWFGGLAAFVLLAIGWGHYSFDSGQTNQPLSKKETAVITDRITKKEPLDHSQQTLKDKSILLTEEPSIEQPFTTADIPTNPSTLAKNIDNFAPINSTVDTEESPNKIANNNLITEVPITEVAKMAPAPNSTKTIEKNVTQRLTFADLPPISTLSFEPLWKQKTVEPIPFISKKRGLWQWGIYAGVTYPKLGSFRAGMSTTKIFHPKWSLQIGLGYARRVLQFKHQSSGDQADPSLPTVFENSAEEDSDSTGLATAGPASGDNMGGNNSTNNQSTFLGNSSNVEWQLNNIHYIELPFLVQYRFQPRWRLELGGKISKLYGYRYQSTNSRPTFASDLSIFSTRADDLLENVDVTDNSSVAKSAINSWELALLGGFSYQLQPNWQVYGQYHYGLTPYLNISDTKRWRQIKLGVRYQFRK